MELEMGIVLFCINKCLMSQTQALDTVLLKLIVTSESAVYLLTSIICKN